MPFPAKVYGLYGYGDFDNNADIVLYSDPLGTPVPEKTYAVDANVIAQSSARSFFALFPSPYTVAKDQPIAAVFKPGAGNISAYLKTIAAAGQRISDVWGAAGYGVSRSSGAFADVNSGLTHYMIGLILGAFDDGASAGGGSGVGSEGHIVRVSMC